MPKKGPAEKSSLLHQYTCHDCDVKEGQFHKPGCDMERCPFCGGQLITCDCCYTKLGYKIDNNHPTSGLPENVYKNGLSNDEWEKWLDMLEKVGRIPYIQWPWVCARCGEVWPDSFMVSNEEWKKYIEPIERDKILCRKCYSFIKLMVDKRGNLK